MKQHKITTDEMKQIAHHIAQRSLATIGPLETKRALAKYMETYNSILDELYSYNNDATD